MFSVYFSSLNINLNIITNFMINYIINIIDSNIMFFFCDVVMINVNSKWVIVNLCQKMMFCMHFHLVCTRSTGACTFNRNILYTFNKSCRSRSHTVMCKCKNWFNMHNFIICIRISCIRNYWIYMISTHVCYNFHIHYPF